MSSVRSPRAIARSAIRSIALSTSARCALSCATPSAVSDSTVVGGRSIVAHAISAKTRKANERRACSKAVIREKLRQGRDGKFGIIAGFVGARQPHCGGESQIGRDRWPVPQGQVAQLVEQRTENPCVGGSIPPLATRFRVARSDRQNWPRWFNSALGHPFRRRPAS